MRAFALGVGAAVEDIAKGGQDVHPTKLIIYFLVIP